MVEPIYTLLNGEEYTEGELHVLFTLRQEWAGQMKQLLRKRRTMLEDNEARLTYDASHRPTSLEVKEDKEKIEDNYHYVIGQQILKEPTLVMVKERMESFNDSHG